MLSVAFIWWTSNPVLQHAEEKNGFFHLLLLVFFTALQVLSEAQLVAEAKTL